MGGRSFTGESTLDGDELALALAPALTPVGVVDAPAFFRGFATDPLVVARALVTLADITRTRYHQPSPSDLRDPVLTANGDRLRAECFSACNGVHARLDLLAEGLDGGEIGRGTTNVDLSDATRDALLGVRRHELLHLRVGRDGLDLSTPGSQSRERPVRMPGRWVRALGNAAEIHRSLTAVRPLDAAAAAALIAAIPAPGGTPRTGWVQIRPGSVRLLARPRPGTVHVAGLHRLSALRRLLPHVRGGCLYGVEDGGAGPSVLEVSLPGARLSIGLTEEPWRGFSGEGSLLTGLAGADARDDADVVAVVLAFDPRLEEAHLARETGLGPARVRSALAVLAASGRVGWDLHEEAYFHRELPHDPDRVERDSPRLAGARRLVDDGAVQEDGARWRVRSGDDDYLVHPAVADARALRCTCTWALRHPTGRGPCKHVLAVRMHRGEDPTAEEPR